MLSSDGDAATSEVLQATRRAVDENGAQITLAVVAQTLGVTTGRIRQYFDSIDDLLIAAAADGMDTLVCQLIDGVRGLRNSTDVVVEGVATAIERLPAEPYVGILLRDRTGTVARAVTSEPARIRVRSAFKSLESTLDHRANQTLQTSHVSDIMLRTVQSFLIDPGEPPLAGGELRGLLRSWLGPTIEATTAGLQPSLQESIGTQEAIAWQLGLLRDALDEDE